MDAQQQIFSLMGIAEDQQVEIYKLITSLAQQRDALAVQNGALQERVQDLQAQIEGVRISASAGAREAVERTMLGVADKASEASRKAAEPLIARMTQATAKAMEATESLHESAANIGARMMLYTALGAAGLMVCAAAIGYGIGAWTESEVVELRQERSHLQASVANFESRAARAILSTCGDKKRLCIQVEPTERFGDGTKQFAIIKGY